MRHARHFALVATTVIACTTAQSLRAQALPDTTPESGSPASTRHSVGYTGLTFSTSIVMTADHKPQAGYSAIAQIDSGSPAQKAGLTVGDLILNVNGIDGRDARALTFYEGRRYLIRVRHQNEERERMLVPTASRK